MYKVFISNIPWTVGISDLRRYCVRFGKLKSCEVIFDYKTGLPRGFGFVQFQLKEEMENFLTQEHKLHKAFIRVKEATF